MVSAVAGVWEEEPAATGLRALGVGEGERSAIRIEVLNGAGTSGLARDATRRLRFDGFDVVFFGNADSFDHSRSVVIDRLGEIGRARSVAGALGIDSVVTAIDSSRMLEVSVVLGDDWPPTPRPRTGWRDRIRGLLGGSEDTPETEPDSPAAPATGTGPDSDPGG